MDCGWMPSVDVSLIGPKRRHLKLEIVFQYDDDAKMRTDRIGSRKKSLHHFRSRVGGDVVVLRRQTADHVAHTTTGEIRDVPILAQACSDFARRFFHRGRFHPGTVAAWPRETQRITERGVLSAVLLLPERMNNKQYHRNRDAGVGNIKSRPGMRIRDVQIEKEKIDHVPVKKPIGKISHDPCEEKCQRKITPTV